MTTLKIPWTEEPVGFNPGVCKELDMIEHKLIYNVLVSGLQQSDSMFHIYIYIFFSIWFITGP